MSSEEDRVRRIHRDRGRANEAGGRMVMMRDGKLKTVGLGEDPDSATDLTAADLGFATVK